MYEQSSTYFKMHQLICRKMVIQILVRIQSASFSLTKLLNRFFRSPYRNDHLKVFNQFPFRVTMHLCLNTKCKKRFPKKKKNNNKNKEKKNNKDTKKTTGEKSEKKMEEGKRKTVGFSVNLPCV